MVHDIYANSAHDIQHKGQAALWVTNGCTSMSKPITTTIAGRTQYSFLAGMATRYTRAFVYFPNFQWPSQIINLADKSTLLEVINMSRR